MREFPDYIFSQSQAKLYADCQQYYPDVFAKVKELVAQKRLEPVGDMWVEPDGNTPCGEAFIRQIMYGRQFFKRIWNGVIGLLDAMSLECLQACPRF